jgi:pyridoxine 5-phosphate synthase
MKPVRLGINIDHVATLRNARGESHPDPLRMALTLAEDGFTDLITVHLREDCRHIRDQDVIDIRRECPLPLNLEMAVTPEMLDFALRIKPDYVCLVPEKRHEVTTEGGLNIFECFKNQPHFIKKLQDQGIAVSLFIDPNIENIEHSVQLQADAVELHTGTYAYTKDSVPLQKAAAAAQGLIQCHAGHGLSFSNIAPVAQIPNIEEFNIGHFLIGEALWLGLPKVVQKMADLIKTHRSKIESEANDR